MATAYSDYSIQLQNDLRGTSALDSGGKFLVIQAGLTAKQTLYDPDNGYASLSNPITPTRGRLRFATLSTVDKVDIYGFTGDGCFVVRKNVYPGREAEIFYDPHQSAQTAVIPVLGSDYTAASENDCGLDFPAGALVIPEPFIRVTVNQSSKTIDVGLLSSESGGDADGFLVAASLNATGTIKGSVTGTDTLGALVKEDTNGSTVYVPMGAAIASAVSITFTPSSGTTTGACFIYLPYRRLLN